MVPRDPDNRVGIGDVDALTELSREERLNDGVRISREADLSTEAISQARIRTDRDAIQRTLNPHVAPLASSPAVTSAWPSAPSVRSMGTEWAGAGAGSPGARRTTRQPTSIFRTFQPARAHSITRGPPTRLGHATSEEMSRMTRPRSSDVERSFANQERICRRFVKSPSQNSSLAKS